MGMYQGSAPQDSRGDGEDLEPNRNEAEASKIDFSELQEYISGQLKSDEHFESRMEVDIRALVDLIAEERNGHSEAATVIESLSNYFNTTPFNDLVELHRRLHAAKDRMLEEVNEQITDETEAGRSRNLLLNILIVRSASKLAEFEITSELQNAHQIFIHSQITPFLESVNETLNELAVLRQNPTLNPAELNRWANSRIPPLAEKKKAALEMSDSWNHGHFLVTSVAVGRVLDSFEKNILPPIELSGPWRIVLGSALIEQFTDGVKSAAATYHSSHRKKIQGGFKKLKDALPPTIRLA